MIQYSQCYCGVFNIYNTLSFVFNESIETRLNLIIPCAQYKNQAYCKIQCYHNVSGLFMIQYKVSEIKPNKKIFSTTILEANYKSVILFREGYCLSTSLKRMEISNTLHAVNRHFWMITLIAGANCMWNGSVLNSGVTCFISITKIRK